MLTINLTGKTALVTGGNTGSKWDGADSCLNGRFGNIGDHAKELFFPIKWGAKK